MPHYFIRLSLSTYLSCHHVSPSLHFHYLNAKEQSIKVQEERSQGCLIEMGVEGGSQPRDLAGKAEFSPCVAVSSWPVNRKGCRPFRLLLTAYPANAGRQPPDGNGYPWQRQSSEKKRDQREANVGGKSFNDALTLLQKTSKKEKKELREKTKRKIIKDGKQGKNTKQLWLFGV